MLGWGAKRTERWSLNNGDESTQVIYEEPQSTGSDGNTAVRGREPEAEGRSCGLARSVQHAPAVRGNRVDGEWGRVGVASRGGDGLYAGANRESE